VVQQQLRKFTERELPYLDEKEVLRFQGEVQRRVKGAVLRVRVGLVFKEQLSDLAVCELAGDMQSGLVQLMGGYRLNISTSLKS